MKRGIADPKLLGFNCKQHMTHAWQVLALKELLQTSI